MKFSKGFSSLFTRFLFFYFGLVFLLFLVTLAHGKVIYSLYPFAVPLELALFFFLVSRHGLLRFAPEKDCLLPAAIAFSFFLLFLFLRVLFLEAELIFRETLTVLSAFFLALSLFGPANCLKILREYGKEVLLSLAFFFVLHLVFFLVHFFWLELSLPGLYLAKGMLEFSFGSAILKPDAIPVLGTQEFSVKIVQYCAGIESLILFVFLFFAGWLTDFFSLHRKKMLFALLFGSALIYLLSVLRLYIIVASGHLISTGFAVKFVHPISALFLFIAFFLAYWLLVFRWAKIR